MAIIDHYAGFVVALLGGLLRDDVPTKDAVAFLRRAKKLGKPVVLATNDSSLAPKQVVTLFEETRVDIDPASVLTAATTAASLLASGTSAPRTLAIGGPGLVLALTDAGIPLVDDSSAEAVVVGFDRDVSLAQLRTAMDAIRNGARFVGTSLDSRVGHGDDVWPGPGATLALLREATGVSPEVVGKPQPMLFERAGELLDIDGPILVVGDGIHTDLSAATKMGWDTALIVESVPELQGLLDAQEPPSWIIPHIGALSGDEPPTVRHATESDLSKVIELLQEAGFYHEKAAARLGQTLVAVAPDGTVVGTISWDVIDSAAHLRGITVKKQERAHGTGSHLVTRALMELRRGTCEWAYLLTPGGEKLFEALGFWRVHRDRVPQEILDRAQFGAVASGGTALVRRLR